MLKLDNFPFKQIGSFIKQKKVFILYCQKEKMNQCAIFTCYRINIQAQPITLYLKRSFNTAHSSSTTRTNFLIKGSLSHSFSSNTSNEQKSSKVLGYGQCGLPPKKPYCYLSDINDCQSFIKIIHQEFQTFQQNLLSNKNQQHQVTQQLQRYCNGTFDQYLNPQTESNTIQMLGFFKQKYQRLLEQSKNNSGYFTAQTYFYLQIFFLFQTAKQLSHKSPQFKAPRNALQFSLLDLIGNLENKSVSELLYSNKSQFKITQNFSFYTISHQQDLQSMLKNGQDSLQFTDCIKIKFNNDVQNLIRLLKTMDQHKVGRKWIIDANASWSPQNFKKFQHLFNQIVQKNPSIKQKILFVEQPFPIFKSLTNDKSFEEIQKQQMQWQKIKQNTCFLIIADESFASCDDLIQVMKYSHGINIKMQKCGGPFQALKILKQMQKNKVSFLMFGSMVSTHLGCTQTFQFYEYAQYFDIDGALLVKEPQINGGFEWKGTEGIKKVNGKGLAICHQDLKKLF